MTMRRLSRSLAFVCLLAGMVRGAEPVEVREEIRIRCTIDRTLSAPADDPMHMPTDVAADSKGRVFVLDGANDRIMRFTPQGDPDHILRGTDADPFDRPVGLTIDAKDRLWLADTRNHRVLITDLDGKLIEKIELEPRAGEPADPTDIAVTANTAYAYIVDNDNHRLLKRDNKSGAVEEYGKFGAALGQFRWPFMVDIASNGDVYTSEAIGARVQRLSPSDRWAGQVSRWGIEPGFLYRPKGVVVDRADRIYVSDSTLGSVQVFDDRGRLTGVLTDADGRVQAFAHPMGMCFDDQGRLYVVELRAHRVAVVSLPEGFNPPASRTDAGASGARRTDAAQGGIHTGGGEG